VTCQHCQTAEATIHETKKLADGSRREGHYCEACFRSKGYSDIQYPGGSDQNAGAIPTGAWRCPKCNAATVIPGRALGYEEWVCNFVPDGMRFSFIGAGLAVLFGRRHGSDSPGQ
jgi:hypothetical protein